MSGQRRAAIQATHIDRPLRAVKIDHRERCLRNGLFGEGSGAEASPQEMRRLDSQNPRAYLAAVVSTHIT